MSPKIGISDIRREELTQAAMECIANKGYDRVTLDDVTKEAGLSKGIASYYFRNREELLVSVIEKMSAQIEELTIKIWGLPEDTKDKEKIYEQLKEYYSNPKIDPIVVIKQGIKFVLAWIDQGAENN